MRNPTILVIDSGIGGLSVTQHIRRKCSAVSVSYIADLSHFPYGEKSEDSITRRIQTLVDYGVRHIRPDLVVIACNTASTIALDVLRQTFAVPFVGVVPAIKPAALKSQSGKIGVLATRATVNRPYTQNLIHSFAKDNNVFLYGSSALVEIAEGKLKGDRPDLLQIRMDVENLIQQHKEMDTVVLACTHFPLLEVEFEMLFPQIKYWVHSGEAIARRVESILTEMGFSATGGADKNRLLITGGAQSAYQHALLVPLLGEFDTTMVTI